MMKKLTVLLLFILALAPLHAEEEKVSFDDEKSGFYIGGGVSSTSFYDDDQFEYYLLDETESGYKFFGGYRFNDNFAAELAYADLGKFTAKPIRITDEKITSEYEATTLSIVGLVPLYEKQIDLFVQGGLGVISVKQRGQWNYSSDEAVILLGAGVAFTLNSFPYLSLKAGLDIYSFYVEVPEASNRSDEDYSQSVSVGYIALQVNF